MSLLKENSRRKILLGQDGNSLVMLIIINVIVFILLNFVNVVYLSTGSTEGVFIARVLNWISVPAQPPVFATRPWTLISFMFTHFGILQLISSMLWLWAFGFILQDLTGNKKLIPLYLYGGLAGSVFFLLVNNLVPAIRQNVNSVYPLIGAGPSLAAVVAAATTLAPRYRIFPMLNIPLWVLTAVYSLITLGSVAPGSYGYLASLIAGAATGCLFVWQLRKGNDLGQWMDDFAGWLNDLFNPNRQRGKTSIKGQLFYKSNTKPFEKTPHVTQQRIDDLLDKINSKGYYSLTDEEKDFLKKASKEEF